MADQVNSSIGITERADPTVNTGWVSWIKAGNPAILITKMPRLLLPMVTPKDNVVVHCTITGLGGTAIEPAIDDPLLSLLYYHDLCVLLGRDRVVLRIDPIIPGITSMPLLRHLIEKAEGKVRISFVDLYPHVVERFRKADVEVGWRSFHAPLKDRELIWRELGCPEVCSEPGLPCTPCVGRNECEILGVDPVESRKGQRALCPCFGNKTELCYGPPKCTYGCLYCYWK